MEETDDSPELKSLIEHRQSGAWEADYRGQPYTGFIQPVESIENCPWSIVTFRGREPLLDFQARQLGGGLILSLAGILIATLFLSVLLLVIKLRGGAVRSTILAVIWPAGGMGRAYRAACVGLALFGAASLGVVALAAISNRQLFGLLLLYFLLAPLLACLIVMMAQRLFSQKDGTPVAPSASDFNLWRWHLLLVLVCASLLPTTGDALLALRVEDTTRLDDWLFHSLENRQQRLNRFSGAIQSSPVLDDDTRGILAKVLSKEADCPTAPKTSVLFSYTLHLRDISLVCAPSASDSMVSTGWAEHLIERSNSLFSSGHALAPGNIFEAGTWIPWRDPPRLTHCLAMSLLCASGEERFFTEFIIGSHWAILLPVLFGIPLVLWNGLGTMVLAKSESSTGKPRRQWWDLTHREDPSASIPSRLLYRSIPGERIQSSLEPFLQATKSSPVMIKFEDGVSPPDYASAINKQILVTQGAVCAVILGFDELVQSEEQRREMLHLLEGLLPHEQISIVLESSGDLPSAASDARLNNLLMQFALAGSATPPAADARGRKRLVSRYDSRQWIERLESETAQFPALERIGQELEALWSSEAEVNEEVIMAALEQRARPFFENVWHDLSKAERLTLVQVAEGCLPNPKAVGAIAELKRKRLLLMSPWPHVFSDSFRRFLCERDRVIAVHRWERESRRGYWVAVREIVAFSAGLGIIFYALTQGRTVESLLTLVTSTGAIFFPKLRDLFAKLPGTSGPGGQNA